MIAGLRGWWLGLARRERAMTAAAAGFALLALLYFVAVEPAWKARARLQAEMPRLREQVAELESLAREAKQLKSRGVAAESAGAAKGALEQSLARANVGAVRVTVIDERRLLVSAKAVPVTQWLAWVEEAARESRLRIATAQIARTAARGVVDAEATLELAARP
jgi:general secretion pathway protein M